MARGGKRPGAGRKPGTVTKKRNLAQAATESTIKALTEGVTPLDILIGAMKEAYDKGGFMAAAPFAKEAAPYVHPKLSSIEAKVDNIHRDAAELTDADLADIASGSSPRAPEATSRTN